MFLEIVMLITIIGGVVWFLGMDWGKVLALVLCALFVVGFVYTIMWGMETFRDWLLHAINTAVQNGCKGG